MEKVKKIAKYVTNILAILNALLVGLGPIWNIPYTTEISESIIVIMAAIGTYLLGDKATTKIKEYKQFKGLTKENLRDNMSTIELALNTLAEASTTEISKRRNPKNLKQNMLIAQEGGNVAKAARLQLETTIGESVVTSIKASDYIRPIEETSEE